MKTAAEAFRRMGEAEGEVIARQNLRFLYHRRGASEAAATQVALAKEAAEKSNAPLAIVRASVLEAAHILDAGGDVGRAHRALLRAERFAFPAAPIALRRTVLFNLANANLYLGRLDDAIDVLERHRALRAEDGSTTDAAPVAYNLLNAHVTQAELRPSAPARAQLVEMAEQRRGGDRTSQSAVRRGAGAPRAWRSAAADRSRPSGDAFTPLPGDRSAFGGTGDSRVVPVVAGPARGVAEPAPGRTAESRSCPTGVCKRRQRPAGVRLAGTIASGVAHGAAGASHCRIVRGARRD